MATPFLETLRSIGALTLKGEIMIDLVMEGKIDCLLKYGYKVKRPYSTLLRTIEQMEKEQIIVSDRNGIARCKGTKIELNVQNEKVNQLIKALVKEKV